MPQHVICLTTVGSRRDGEKIARHLVRKKLAACVNVIPSAISFYDWKKKPCRDREAVLLIKTTKGRLKALEGELHRIHPYELPEFIVLPVIAGSRRYLNWLAASVKE